MLYDIKEIMDKTDIPDIFNAEPTLGVVNETNMARILNKHKTNTPPKRKVFVGMSGGVDSSVTAALLKERGFDVTGVHIKMWSDPAIPCQFKDDRRDALRVADRLKIPFETWDLTEEYRREVVDYMIREYAGGRTPNPDVMCNRKIKFGLFFERALARGADYIATGHYTRSEREFPIFKSQFPNKKERESENCKLKIAKDLNKDQSYFLWTLTQKQLKHCLFPIGDYLKPDVREMAQKFGLPTAEKPDSQGICFIGEIDMKNFLKQHIAEHPGEIITTSGRTIGAHDGLSFYTIGQREGLGIGGGIPYYVAKKDFAANVLTVAEGPYDDALFSGEALVSDINWISGVSPEFPYACDVRIRYRQPVQRAVLSMISDTAMRIDFEQPQRAITPGQSAVFYDGEVMAGGGCIYTKI